MIILDLKNNLNNIDFFKRYSRGARLSRGKNIPDKNIINFNAEKVPQIKVIADVQGSGNSRYVIHIIQENNGFKIIHDCPDFRKGFKFCKHIVKIFLLLDTDICKSICQNYNRIIFSSNFDLVKKSKTESYIIKAEDLIQQTKYYEAISFLNQAFEESKNLDYLNKIGVITLKYELFDLFLEYSVRYKELVNKYLNDYPKIICSTISRLKEYGFSKKVEILINIKKLLINFPKDQLLKTLRQSDIYKIDMPILRYLLLHNLDSKIYVDDYFKDILKKNKLDLKEFMEKITLDLVNEAILNMESEEVIDSYSKIMIDCAFNNYNKIKSKIDDYKRQLREIYKESLKSKHAFLRSLVIANTNSDKLRQMKFTKKYNYPSLIWGSTYKNESDLYYYILEKCGFESHHLEYTEVKNFIENFPVFAEIFSGNNPITFEIKNFWGSSDPKIMNIVQSDPIVELDYEVNFQELEKFILIEWDLAQKPILGSYICQFSDGFLIPDKSHPLTHYIRPFDLILCERKPIAIKSDNIKIMKPLRRISIKSAIELIWEGIEYIASYIPLNIIESLRNYRIDELDAIEKIYEKFNNAFLPDKEISKNEFQDFIQNNIVKELNKAYLKIINEPNSNNKVLKMIGYEQYSRIFIRPTIIQDFQKGDLKKTSLQELKLDLKKYISKKLADLIKNQEYDSIDLKVLKKFPKFKVWTVKLIYELKQQLEKCKIYQIGEKSYDIQNLLRNYYGKTIILKALNENFANKMPKILISESELSKIIENFKYLKLKLPQIIEKKM
ncbi:MAG: hypothetical protein ACFFBF_11995 [Promethearchaeota archaeon]